MENFITIVKPVLLDIQTRICQMLENEDGKAKFSLDEWQREKRGGGRTMVLKDGQVFEQAGVNFSHVYGTELPKSASAIRPEVSSCPYHALGVSVVIHPKNPFIPTSHFNVRLFIGENKNHEPIWWFGGGFDLTPYYGFHEDCVLWHQHAKAACEPFGSHLYPKFKAACDDYFYLKHREEARGIGGLFFDDFNELGFKPGVHFIDSVATHFIKAYQHIVNRRKNTPFSEKQKEFQLYRRGRYVEFNLLYDRGTLFGLQSGGRTESILMSLPPMVNFRYNWQPEPHSLEAKLYTEFLPCRDWLSVNL